MTEARGLDTSVTIGAIRLPNAVIAASGTFGYGTEFAGLVDLAALGAVGVKGLSLAPVTGRLVAELVGGETPSHDLAPFSPDRFRRATGA